MLPIRRDRGWTKVQFMFGRAVGVCICSQRGGWGGWRVVSGVRVCGRLSELRAGTGGPRLELCPSIAYRAGARLI